MTGRASRRKLLKYVGAGSVVGLAGCTDSDSGSDGTPTDSGGENGGAETSVEITVGVLASLSGPYSGLGVDLREGVKTAKRHLESGV